MGAELIAAIHGFINTVAGFRNTVAAFGDTVAGFSDSVTRFSDTVWGFVDRNSGLSAAILRFSGRIRRCSGGFWRPHMGLLLAMLARPPHRVWVFSLLAWAALVVIPTAFIVISWLLGGPGRDPSVPNVFDLFPFAFFFTLPAALVTFALLVPLALAADLGLRGRTTRPMNIALGAGLGVAAFALFFAISALLQVATPFTPRSMIAGGVSTETVSRVLAAPQTAAILAVFMVSGMLVGLGLRQRRTA